MRRFCLRLAHLEQLHERHRALILDQPTLRQRRAHLGVVHPGRLGIPSRLDGLHARVLPLREARRDVHADRAGLLGVERRRAALVGLSLSELLEERQLRVAHGLDQRAHVSARVYRGEVDRLRWSRPQGALDGRRVL